MKIVNLKTDYLVNPLGIKTKKPMFSWQLEEKENDCWQKAYTLHVWEKEGKKTVYRTGRVEQSISLAIPYEGEELKPKTEYEWQVEVWNEANNSVVSEVQSFETTLLSKEDWIADFVEPDPMSVLSVNPYDTLEELWKNMKNTMMDGEEAYHNISDMPNESVRYNGGIDLDSIAEPYVSSVGGFEFFGKSMEIPCQPYDPVVRIRRIFNVSDEIIKGRLYITAHGIYHVMINGKEITDVQFAPGFTSYDKILAFQSYDITEFIHKGENVIAVEIADGWYKGKISMGKGNNYGDVPGILFQMELEGKTEKIVVCSDEKCKYSYEGPYCYSDIFKGERYDASKEQTGWNSTAYDDKDWKAVRKAYYDKSILFQDMAEGVRSFEILSCKEIIRTPEGDTVLDFGQNMAGRIRMKVNGAKGCEIILEHGETLSKEGNFYYACAKMPGGEQTDYYICNGDGEVEYEPKFTYHGFRYVRITGYPGKIEKENFKAVALSSDCKETGSFHCSNASINQLQSNIRWSQRSNIFSIPTDCPTRERAGWTGDVWIYGETACYMQDLYNFFDKWLKNVRMDQAADGRILPVVPELRSYIHLNCIGSTGWGDVIVKLPLQMYQIYGNKSILEENYEAMKAWMDYGEKQAYNYMPRGLGFNSTKQLDNQHYLWNTGFHFGDWLVPSIKDDNGFSDGVKSAFMTMGYVTPMIYAHSAMMMVEIAGILGKEEDKEKYNWLYKRISEAFCEECINEDGALKMKLQGLYILALQCKIIPEEKRPLFVKELVALIHENGDILDTGFLSVPYLMDVLCENGEEKLAYTLLYQKKCPSWLYEVEHGATTMWESWDVIREDGNVGLNSLNHYAFGCIGSWMYRELAGIQCSEPGYHKITVAPRFNCGLTEVFASYASAYGTIEAAWKKSEKTIELTVNTPANTGLCVKLPEGHYKRISINGEALDILTMEHGFNLGNGKFYIVAEVKYC
jgi:alpha-L-rhamnosidase